MHDQTGADVAHNPRNVSRIGMVYNELRATGKLLDNKLDWLIGGTYSTVKDREDQFEDLTDLTNSYVLTELVPQPLKFVNVHMTQDIATKALFGNLEYYIS